ncbi:hypothetical protein HG530_012296 [Fusarium avenaceum]|nr:hypothetical protein HG530_012296 [Fusarium avenaceum]
MLASSLVFDSSKTLLGSPDDGFLLLCLERLPCFQIMKVFLHDDVAASYRSRVVIRGDEDCICNIRANGVGRSIDKAEYITCVKIPETDGLIL